MEALYEPTCLSLPLTQEQLDALSDEQLVRFVNAEHVKHLQCKSSAFEGYTFDIDDGVDGIDPATKKKAKHHFFRVKIYACADTDFEYYHKVYYHKLNC